MSTFGIDCPPRHTPPETAGRGKSTHTKAENLPSRFGNYSRCRLMADGEEPGQQMHNTLNSISGYNPEMHGFRLPRTVLRIFYRQFYNRFAFTYDAVSAIVSRREWREWTRAAIPLVQGPRVLEVAFGTGNLLLDLAQMGYDAVGIDLSPNMIEIARKKLLRRGMAVRLVRARVQLLPFTDSRFDCVVMTFPPGFVSDPAAMEEIHRVLCGGGRLVWVDAPYIYPRDPWSYLLNRALTVVGSASNHLPDNLFNWSNGVDSRMAEIIGEELLLTGGWEWTARGIDHRSGYVHVIIGTKISPVT